MADRSSKGESAGPAPPPRAEPFPATPLAPDTMLPTLYQHLKATLTPSAPASEDGRKRSREQSLDAGTPGGDAKRRATRTSIGGGASSAPSPAGSAVGAATPTAQPTGSAEASAAAFARPSTPNAGPAGAMQNARGRPMLAQGAQQPGAQQQFPYQQQQSAPQNPQPNGSNPQTPARSMTPSAQAQAMPPPSYTMANGHASQPATPTNPMNAAMGAPQQQQAQAQPQAGFQTSSGPSAQQAAALMQAFGPQAISNLNSLQAHFKGQPQPIITYMEAQIANFRQMSVQQQLQAMTVSVWRVRAVSLKH